MVCVHSESQTPTEEGDAPPPPPPPLSIRGGGVAATEWSACSDFSGKGCGLGLWGGGLAWSLNEIPYTGLSYAVAKGFLHLQMFTNSKLTAWS